MEREGAVESPAVCGGTNKMATLISTMQLSLSAYLSLLQ